MILHQALKQYAQESLYDPGFIVKFGHCKPNWGLETKIVTFNPDGEIVYYSVVISRNVAVEAFHKWLEDRGDGNTIESLSIDEYNSDKWQFLLDVDLIQQARQIIGGNNAT